VTGVRGRRGTHPLDDLEEIKGYYNSKEEAVGRSPWEIRVRKSHGPLVRQTA
jgi:hypothetical protein